MAPSTMLHIGLKTAREKDVMEGKVSFAPYLRLSQA